MHSKRWIRTQKISVIVAVNYGKDAQGVNFPNNIIHNWTPITLLKVDFKIASKAIAKHFESILPSLIHSDQTGFVKGRYIGENIRLINDIIETTKSQNLPGILTSLDFWKAFDSLDWPFIAKTLDYFNFGSDIKRWVSAFYTKIQSTAVNNRYTRNWFKPSKGVRQGCPLSPLPLPVHSLG